LRALYPLHIYSRNQCCACKCGWFAHHVNLCKCNHLHAHFLTLTLTAGHFSWFMFTFAWCFCVYVLNTFTQCHVYFFHYVNVNNHAIRPSFFKIIVFNDIEKCNILIMLLTLIICGRMNKWAMRTLLNTYAYCTSTFSSLFSRFKTTNMEMVFVQQAKKEKGGKGKW